MQKSMLSLGHDFWILRVSESLNIFASKVLLIVLTWYCVDMQKNPSLASVYLGTFYMFLILNGILFSSWTDRYKKQFFIYACGICGLAASIMIYLGLIHSDFKLAVFISIYLLSVGSALFDPIVNALIPQLVPQALIEKAYTQSFSLRSFFNMAGIFFGAFLMDFFGASVAQLFSIVLFLIGLVMSFFIRFPAFAQQSHDTVVKRSLWTNLQYFKKCHFEVWWSLLSFCANLIFVPLVSLMIPLYVSQYLKESSQWVAFFEASISFGMLIMALFVFKQLSQKIKSKISIVFFSFFAVGAGLFILANNESRWLWMLTLFVIGAAIIANNTTIESVRSVCIPQSHRGFFQTLHSVIIQMSIPLGMFIVGYIQGYVSVQVILNAMALVFTSLAFLVLKIPDLQFFLQKPISDLEGIYDTFYKLNQVQE